MADKTLESLTEIVEADARRLESNLSIVSDVKVQEETIYDEAGEDEIKIIPAPNFSDAKSVGTVLPINMVSETVNNLSKLDSEKDLVTRVQEKLNYATRLAVIQVFSSEQVDAIALCIQQFEKKNAFILGDSAGIGKGRTCAAMLRYAYQNKLTPIFITHKPYLFSDIYRDIKAIGGFGVDKNNNIIEPVPFILNSGNIEESTVRDRYGNAVAVPLTNALTLKVCETLELPKKGNKNFDFYFNCVFMTYSQLSNVRTDTKQRFLEALAPRSIIVFDESHNAASTKSTSKVLVRSLPLIENSQGVMFSSATYAKNPDVFQLYVVKTSLRTAVPSLDSIADALKVGGENVSEYIASGLVKEGQMIRRERSFGDCEKVTLYVDDPNQRAFYDEAIGYYKELRDFSKGSFAQTAIRNSIEKKCASINRRLADKDEYMACFQGSAENRTEKRNAFFENNRGKYVLFYTSDSITRYKMFFRENLFYALKAKYTADKVIETLNTPVEYTNVDGKMYNAPKKPIIAIRNTNESIFNMLDFEEGQRTSNDFSEYLRAIYKKLFSGEFTLRKVNNNLFEYKTELIERGLDIDDIEERYSYEVGMDDFSDGGIQIQDIQSRLYAYRSELPMSAIDYIKDRINTAARSAAYFDKDGKAMYGNESPYYTFNEATGRKSMLKRDGDAYIYTRNDKLASTTAAFRSYNNGATDVLLINVSASTGGSAQSSPEEGSDTRPRDMFIVQFELDINVEVQKRGRINRTGQLNNPTYTYVISKIPVEQRTYLMFRKKLRKLDANISANQTQSSQLSEIMDAYGNPIQDLFNVYGFETFKNDFIFEPAYSDYKVIFDELAPPKDSEYEGEENEFNAEQFNRFVRELELYPADFQETFFNVMNQRYIEHVDKLKSTGDYQLELVAKNYKAAVKQRVVVRLNSGSTVFSMPLFLEDNYTLEESRAWPKDRLLEKANSLAGKKQLSKFHQDLLRDYAQTFEEYKAATIENIRSGAPVRSAFETQEEYDNAVALLERRIAMTIQSLSVQKADMLSKMVYFTPLKKVSWGGNLGMFVGYKIKETTKFKYSNGSVEFIFCFLNRYPIIHLKLSSDKEDLDEIMNQSNTLFAANAPRMASDAISMWRPDYNKRTIRRFMSGNILSAIVEADKQKKEKVIRNFALTRYTNVDGSISTAIELKLDSFLDKNNRIKESSTILSVACNNDRFIGYIGQMPTSYDQPMPVWDDKLFMAMLKKDEDDTDMLYVNIIGYVYKGELVNETSINYNPIYADKELERKYRSHFVSNGDKVIVDYFPKKQKKINGEEVVVEQGSKSRGVFVKSFVFDLRDDNHVQRMKSFFNDLYAAHEVSFNFRSSIDDYYFIENQPDLYNPASQLSTGVQFAEGEYEYRFSKLTPESTAKSIPGYLRSVPSGYYGGVILSKPLAPTMLPSYNLKPFGLPNEVMVNLFLAELNTTEKAEFKQNLRDLADKGSDLEVGQYAERFIRTKSVPVVYFFGDLRTSEYGKIFSNFIKDKSYSDLSFATEETVKEIKPAKTIPVFEDVENFLIYLL